MAIKKFLGVFILILFSFLFIAGFSIIAVINNAEAQALLELQNPDDPSLLPGETQKPGLDFSEYVDVLNPVNFIVMVPDNFKNTDTMVLLNYDPLKKTMNAMFLPRDSYIPEHEGIKMNALYSVYGEHKAKDILSELLNTNIKYYFILNYDVVEKVFDEFGGITYTIPIDMHYDDPDQNLHIHFDKGQTLHMSGKKAIEYLRYRKPNNGEYAEGQTGTDLERIERQKVFIKEFIRQKTSFFYVNKLNAVINEVFRNLQTNIDIQTAFKLITYIPDFDMESITWHKMPGELNPDDDIGDFLPDYIKARELTSQYFKDTAE
ncbi:MAG: LCP family protein [Clostridia bacterium]